MVCTANWVIIYHRSHLLREPETAIDITAFSHLTATPNHRKQPVTPRLDIPEKYIATLGTNVDCGHGVIQAELDHRSLVVDFLGGEMA